MNQITFGIAETVIKQDASDGRFENFTNAIVGKLEGDIPIVRTSASWDLGRDGRGAFPGGSVYCCSSLTEQVDSKSESDIRRMSEFIKIPARVYFCSSQGLSEHRVRQIEAHVQELVPKGVDVTVYGAKQLAELAERWPEVIGKYYPGELEEIFRVLRGDSAPLDADVLGLRLALMTVGHEDSVAIRRELYEASILTVLVKQGPATVGMLCKRVSDQLRLGRPLPDTTLTPHIGALEASGKILERDAQFAVTSDGRHDLSQRELAAAGQLLTGRHLIREALEGLLGQRLIRDLYDAMWRVFEDRLTNYFYERGEHMVQEVCRFTGEATANKGAAKHAELPGLSFVDELAAAVASTSSHSAQQSEIRTAVKDVFSEPTGPAAEWLVRLASGYVAACSLGLEATSGRALARVISRMTLVLDTDVVLSLLCEGEPEHHAVEAFVTRWRKLGGAILIGAPVAHEVAHHAWIAKYDYEEVKKLLPGTRADRLRLVENAFVRAFGEVLERREATPRQWESYISQYRGARQDDASKVLGLLGSEYGVQTLPPRSAEEADIERRAREFLEAAARSRTFGGALRIALDKAKRDAVLYSSMIRLSRSVRQQDSGAGCFLVSSAKRLADLEEHFKELGELHVVIPISVVVYFLSLVPNVSLGIGALRVFLFDESRPVFTSALDRTLLRVVMDSKKYSMPWARRGELMRAVRTKLVEDASPAGRQGKLDMAMIEGKALSEKGRPRTVEILQEALEEVAATTREEVENRKLREQLRQLQTEVDVLRRRPARRG